MDMIKTGRFLKELRKERELTQEQLGEKLGVTNKTVSRWETGTYMPPVECLAMLSDIYGVSINEIVAGQRLSGEQFTEAAEENLSEALRSGEDAFGQTEKRLGIMMGLSAILTIAILILMPKSGNSTALDLLMILLVVGLGFISSTVNLAALILNKEKYGKK